MTYQTINPATGLTVKTYPEISDTDLENALATAQVCFETDWRHRSVADRARIVSGAAATLRENAEEYARYITLEMGKLIGTAPTKTTLPLSRHISTASTRGLGFLLPAQTITPSAPNPLV